MTKEEIEQLERISSRAVCKLMLGFAAILSDFSRELLREAECAERDSRLQDSEQLTTLKVAGEPYVCACGSSQFIELGAGSYKCPECGNLLSNKAPDEEKSTS